MKGYDPRIKLLSIIHDAAEAYVSDMPKPLKPFITGYREMEYVIQRTIHQALDINPPTTDEKFIIKKLDTIMLLTEGKSLMPFNNWDTVFALKPDDQIKISEMRPSFIESIFRGKFKKYKTEVEEGML
jgi:5'-deoxynucleotidase YfbR-like HD superfamily hydrolase